MPLRPEDIDMYAVAAQVPVAWSIIDLDGNQVLGNETYAALFGRTMAEMSELHVRDLTHPDDRDDTDQYLGRLIRGEVDRHEVDKRYLRADGSWFVGHLVASLLRGPDGEPLALVGTIDDVTEHRRAETELAAMHDDAVWLAERRVNFIANVSHELRTPLHAVLGLAELLAEELSDPDQADTVRRIQREAGRLRTTVDDLLEYTRFEAEGIVLEPGPTDIVALVERVAGRAEATAHARGLDVRVVLDPVLDRIVELDEHRVGQLLTNLVGNAVKFTAEGEVTVAAASPVPGWVRFEVTDTGPGIAADQRDRVFEPFVRLPGSSQSTEGSGLGLALVRSLTEVMGGSISLDEAAGGGARFVVELPAPTSEDRGDGGLDRSVTQADHPVSVLVVEDTEVNQILVRRQLERLGHLPMIVGTAREGLAALADADHGVEVVLMDWQLPDLDGLEATRRLRELERDRTERVPVVAMTASAMPEQREACRAAGMDDVLPKPVSLGELHAMINRWSSSTTASEGPVRVAHVSGTEPFDPGALDRLVHDLDDRLVVERLVDTYLGELDGRRAAIERALASGDLDSLHRIAHTLRSTSSMLGGTELSDLCAELEGAPSCEQATSAGDRLGGVAARTRASLGAWRWAGPT